MTFYVIAGLMTLLALVFVLVPLWRQTPRVGVSIDEGNVEALRVQRREVVSDHARGLIDDIERDRVLDELTARLAEQISPESKPQQQSAASGKNSAKPAWMLGFVLSVLVVGSAVGGYAMWGAHQARQLAPTAGGVASVDPDQPMSEQQVLALVENLARKMQSNPDDAKGWMLLARSQNALGQWAAAASAYERAVALTTGDVQLLSMLLADYADVQAMLQEGVFAGKPMALIQRALKLDANNTKALALAGTAEMRAGNKAQSIKHWQKLQSLLPKESADHAQVVAIINEIKTGKPAFPASTASTAPPPSPPNSASRPAAVAPAPPQVIGAAIGKVVSGQVSIARELARKVDAGDTLFILARAVNGPRMPLAVLRVAAPTGWPYAFELNDAMAMAPGMNLSSFADVTIEARISKSGDASLRAGDLHGVSSAVAPPSNAVRLVIDKVAP